MKNVDAVIFDLDGTLTEPYLDFDAIRAEIGGIEGPLLEAMERMGQAERQRCWDILHRYELDAAENSKLNPGAKELLEWLSGHGLKVGLATRNRLDSVERICKIHGIRFDSVVTRDDGPVKPDAFPFVRACVMADAEPGRSVMVGDFLFDLQSGKAGGGVSVLIATNEEYRDFVHEADYVIHRLDELIEVIEKLEGNGKI